MRIVSGSLKARQLISPTNSKVRPTTDKLRSAIFSILSDEVIDANILDAFAGTGALGLEAISRGAKRVTFVDTDISSVSLNVKMLDISIVNVRKSDFLNIAKSLCEQYDIIFIDPPYGEFESIKILQTIKNSNILKQDGVIIYEEFYKSNFKPIDEYKVVDERKYGDTIVRFIRSI